MHLYRDFKLQPTGQNHQTYVAGGQMMYPLCLYGRYYAHILVYNSIVDCVLCVCVKLCLQI